MAGRITEFFGYRVEDISETAAIAAQNSACPFIHDVCTKTIMLDGKKIISGACAVTQKADTAPDVICCPNRLYADDYRMLHEVAELAFGCTRKLYSGRQALEVARVTGEDCVAVFGHRWGGELRLPKKDGRSNYFVDWILALVSPEGILKDFCAIEVQTIDTTGNYRESRRAIIPPRREVAWSTVGINWENVNKRILPQIIYQAQVLARERLCESGMFFVVPLPVYETIMKRLGGEDKVLSVGRLQPSSITFLAYGYDNSQPWIDGQTRSLKILKQKLTMVAEVREAFNRAELPEANVYGKAIQEALGL